MRTLHHYDDIGLLKPAHIGANGYLLYVVCESTASILTLDLFPRSIVTQESRQMVPRWRDLAQVMLPEIYSEERPDSIYDLFLEMKVRICALHESGGTDQLARIHAFAEWSSAHQEYYISNAADVSFYEDLFDRGVPVEQIVPWLCRDRYEEVKGLFEYMFQPATVRRIEQAMTDRDKSHETLIHRTLIKHLNLLSEEFERKSG